MRRLQSVIPGERRCNAPIPRGDEKNPTDQLAAFLEEALAVRKGFFILWLRPQVFLLDTLQPDTPEEGRHAVANGF